MSFDEAVTLDVNVFSTGVSLPNFPQRWPYLGAVYNGILLEHLQAFFCFCLILINTSIIIMCVRLIVMRSTGGYRG